MRRTSTAALALAAALTVAACGTETDTPGAGADAPTGSEEASTSPGDEDASTSPGDEDASTSPGDEEASTSPGDPDQMDDADDKVLAGTRGGGHFFIDSLAVRQAESDPVQLFLDVEGNAPTPCHTVAYEVDHEADAILVHVTTVEAEGVACTQVLVPYELSVPLGETDTFPVTVDVNDGEHVLTVDA
ncbi:hypothetical protein [Ornithinimicrobium sufpigmenti]|uniref:hypothetical protein n=1 Tax=Ornithinimicrobium sufpigmenti TaxID=2508882 RepID=UPI001036E250|nr:MULTISPECIES: hypothetical protein [unclassified Ornithinimicrobium]